MHAFLRFISPFTESILWKIMLEEKDKYKQPLLPEIKNYIAYLYYALNIETIIAKNPILGYYDDFIENKMAIKQQFIQNPEPHLLWNA
ncbi:MAG TPA: hypothetical protein VKU36_05390 [Candidatus Babeliales bacterium]|nr:hypothetical protein [Candidatus Babeliales bacterium]